MILLIDNYDSFSYNLFQLVGGLVTEAASPASGCRRESSALMVIRNDEKTVAEIAQMKPEAIILSPGPGRPAQAGVCIEVIRQLKGMVPILGVCLGHQAICEAFGGAVTYAPQLMHGKSSEILLDSDSRLFRQMGASTMAARYHSLIADREQMPECLKITAETAAGEVMAVEHREYPIYGVQFHPESILTAEGAAIIKNFLEVI